MEKITVQETDKIYLKHLFGIGKELRDAFLEEIEQAGGISHFSDFTKIYQRITKVHPVMADKIICALFNIYDLFGTSNVEFNDFASALVNTFKESAQRLSINVESEKDLRSFELFFIKILALFDKLRVRDNVLRLMPQHQHLFVRSELYSDIRPVFRLDDPSVMPSASAIVHSLKIVYREGTETKDFYLGLDYDDLHHLKGTIERAILKHKSLKEMISKIGMGFLELET